MITIFDLRKDGSQELIEKLTHHFDEEVTVKSMGQASMKACIGCWNCWVKTPGKCVMQDDMSAIYTDYVNSSAVVLLVDTAQGFVDHRAKCFLDRTIPHYHPYIQLKNNECHHMPRYDSYPDIYFYYDTEALTNSEDKVIEDYLYRTAFHFKGDAYRIVTGTGLSITKLAPREAARGAVPKLHVSAMKKLVIYNGSPRLKASNSALIIDAIKSQMPDRIDVRDLKNKAEWTKWADDFATDEHVLFFMPLYVHAMPSHVMEFIELLEPSKGSMSFVVQSGFPESSQSHYLEAYFVQLSLRLDRTYLGTAIKGGIEGLQIRPPQGQDKVIAPFVSLVKTAVSTGKFDSSHIDQMAKPIHLSKRTRFLYQYLAPKKLVNFYWNMQLKKNNAFEKRFDQPYK